MMRTATPGDHVDRYRIDRKLTEGGMAEVYLGHRAVAGFDRPVVLKSLLPGFVDNHEHVAMMRNEARIAARLNHPNIVRVEDLVDVGGRPFIVMEYLEGQNLRQIVHRALTLQRTLALGFICRVVEKILAGLEHAHALVDGDGRPLGLVHRDVSLANVIVTWSGRVTLIDFGIAKATALVGDELTRAGHVKGKSAYMSPEQVRREPLDARSDLFSVGVVLWEMLTQRRLFARRSEIDSMMAICCQDAAPPSSIAPELPAAFDEICRKALARDREQRWQTAAEMRHALEALIAAEGMRASPDELRAELAALFPVESGADEAPKVVADVPIAPGLYDEEERPTTLSPRRGVVADVPLPLPPPPSPARPPTLRSTEMALYNQRVPGPSVYDDWLGGGDRRRRLVGRAVALVALACALVVAAVTLVQAWQGAGR